MSDDYKLALPLVPPKSDVDVEKISHTLRVSNATTGIQKSITLRVSKISDDATPYQILTFLVEFHDARQAFTWIDAELYVNMGQHLYGYLKDEWTTCAAASTAARGATQTTANFDAAMTLWRAQVLPSISFHEQINKLRRLKKPFEMAPTQFLGRLRAIIRLSSLLPGAVDPHPIDNDELKRIFFYAHPTQYQDKFLESGSTIEDSNLTGI